MGIVENTYAELKQQELKNNPYSCLHMADIDINPHQVEAFTFALSSLELGGAILADEVGLGKTIEAGLVIKYLLCSGKNKILLIMPSNLRKQWQVELEEKFDIDSLIVDSSNWEDYLARVKSKQAVIIVSYHFASKRKTEFGKIAWDFCVFDEAHRLRNVYKNGSKMANSLYELTKGVPKILLTATPMQNTLLDISLIFQRFLLGEILNLNFTSLMKIWVALLRMFYVRLMTWLFVWMKRIVTMPQHQRKRLII